MKKRAGSARRSMDRRSRLVRPSSISLLHQSRHRLDGGSQIAHHETEALGPRNDVGEELDGRLASLRRVE